MNRAKKRLVRMLVTLAPNWDKSKVPVPEESKPKPEKKEEEV